MGDSDDDGDYKRRDKFRTERRGYDGSVDRGISPRHDRGEWRESRGGGGSNWNRDRRGGYNEGGGYRRERYPSPPGRRHEMSPPHKRMRDDNWDDRYESGYGHQRGGAGGDYYHRGHAPHMRSYSAAPHAQAQRVQDRDGDLVQPPMMSFKAFLATQDDGISDEDAIKKFSEYKLEFKRQQLNEFFVTHKDEEWFKLKYHPEDSVKRREELKAMLQRRVDVFVDFLKRGKFDNVAIDGDQSDKLVRVLDSVVILLEGGSEYDLQCLERGELDKKDEGDKAEGEDGQIEAKTSGDKSPSQEKAQLQKKAKEYLEGSKSDSGDAEGKGRKRKRTKEYDDESSSSSSSEDEEAEVPPGKEKLSQLVDPPNPTEEKPKNGEDDEGAEEDGEEEEGGAAKSPTNGKTDESVDQKNEEQSKEEAEEKSESGARALHKTASIFLRNLPPTITKQEVEAMCKRYPGFLRAAISDPQPERRWFRRGWVTFERNVKIKDICYSFNNIRLRDCELGSIVNRDLSRRIRTATGLTVDKKVVRNDIRLAAKVITNLDKRWGLWTKDSQEAPEETKKEGSNDDMMGLVTNNPLLSNITDYLIEEASAEEEELLGKIDGEEGEVGEDGNAIVRDEELIKVLDRLLFYLRIVHSVDYYNHSEYPNEDEMPNRCGIMHARAPIQAGGKVAPFEIEEYCAAFEKRMGSFLQPRAMLSDDEAAKLGMKNEEDEVEKFVQANTQELGKDKWLCPLSGKKFKGPDFVRKHIFNKHGEKVEEVKKEVKYYNNYLKDPKRPQLPENPQNKVQAVAGSMGRSGGQRDYGASGQRGGYHYSGYPREATSYPVYDDSRERGGGGYENRYDRGGYRGRGRYDSYGGGRGGRVTQIETDPRSVIDYSDVDFSRDADFF